MILVGVLSALIALAARAAASPIEEDDDPTSTTADELPDGASEAPLDERPGADHDDEAPPSPTDARAARREDGFAPTPELAELAELGRVHDARVPRRVPTAWGRIDLSLAWRSTERDLRRSDELWLVATWRP